MTVDHCLFDLHALLKRSAIIDQEKKALGLASNNGINAYSSDATTTVKVTNYNDNDVDCDVHYQFQ